MSLEFKIKETVSGYVVDLPLDDSKFDYLIANYDGAGYMPEVMHLITDLTGDDDGKGILNCEYHRKNKIWITDNRKAEFEKIRPGMLEYDVFESIRKLIIEENDLIGYEN